MQPSDIQLIKEKVCPLISSGEAALLLGAGFSLGNVSLHSKLPNGDGLRDILLNECGVWPGSKATLKDAYSYASRKLPDLKAFLKNCFTVAKVNPWQEQIFHYVWSRIYTTNIDNVLNVGYQVAKHKGMQSADFTFLNYCDSGVIGHSIGSIPVISIHETIEKLEDGFIFSNAEYALAASRKVLDWHNELAAKILVGGLIVIGNQLDESDIDTHIAARTSQYGNSGNHGRNWIVMPNPDEIKKENYIAAGYDVIDAKAEEFFDVIFQTLRPRKIGELLLQNIPALKKHSTNVKAMVWFKEAFNPVFHEIEKAGTETGILRHFITGSHPRWFYIYNNAHAKTSKISSLTTEISNALTAGKHGIGIFHVTGPSGSGKTTGIRAALQNIIGTHPYVYEFESENGIDVDYLWAILNNFTDKAVLVFYSAAAYYYAVNALALRVTDTKQPFVLFILEDRTNSYTKNLRHLPDCQDVSQDFSFGNVSLDDAESLARKISEHGIKFSGFSELPVEKQAKIILDKERGFGGDLLPTLFSLTTHENFEKKIHQEYHSVGAGFAKDTLDIVAIMGSLGFSIPMNYLSGFLGMKVAQINPYLDEDLVDIVIQIPPNSHLMCRHRVIADCYFNTCIARNGQVDLTGC